MKNKLHIIIASEEGRAKSFVISRTRLRAFFQFFLVSIITLSLLSIASVCLFLKGGELKTSLSRLEVDLYSTKNENESLKEKVTNLDKEKEQLLSNAVNDLNRKSKAIESVLSKVGVKIEKKQGTENSGGPFTSLSEKNYENALFIAEKYLETFQNIPLGLPVQGRITSAFGKRVDPLNAEPAFHEGVDIKAPLGTPVRATAGGIVMKRGFDNGYGWFVLIDHGNGFHTRYCHLKKISVGYSKTISRGDVVGLVGNSGRSTGPHVHYEIHENDQLVNPNKFIRIAAHNF